MNTKTLDRLEGNIIVAKAVGHGALPVPIQELSELLSIARRAADVEGIATTIWHSNYACPYNPKSSDDISKERQHATAVSRYVMGDTT